MFKKKTRKNNEEQIIRIRPAEEQDVEEYRREKNRRSIVHSDNRLLVLLAVVLLLVFVYSLFFHVSVTYGHFDFAYILQVSTEKATNMIRYLTGQGAESGVQFIFNRYVICILCGAVLAMSGACYQGAFRNLLAAPSILGVQSGGSLGNIIYVLGFVSAGTSVMRFTESSAVLDSMTFLERNIQQALVLAGCLGVVLLVVGVTTLIGRGKMRTVELIMSGIILNSLIGTVTGVVQYGILAANPYDIRVQIIRNLTMGSLDRSFTTEHLLTMCAFLIPCTIVMLLLTNRMNILSLGEDEAKTMGINTKTFRIIVIGLNTVAMAVVISFCGNIGFLGFIAPLAARRLVGPNFRRLLPASMILGALLLLVVYDAAQLFGLASYLNLLTSGFGSVLMIIAFLKGKGALDAA